MNRIPVIPASVNPKPNGDIFYDYIDADGCVLHQTVRKADKQFLQRRPGGNGSWIWDLKGVERVLYNLPALLTDPGTVYIVEGEKDVDRLIAENLLATTNSGGAGRWKSEYVPTFADRDVVILPDNDEQGLKHAGDVALSLHGTARSVKLIELPDLVDKGDVSDWLDNGHAVEDLKSLVESQPVWTPPTPAKRKTRKKKEAELSLLPSPCTDVANRLRLLDRLCGKARYCHTWNSWMYWDGKAWKRDVVSEIKEQAMKVERDILGEASETDDKTDRQEKVKWAKQSQTVGRVEAMINLLRSHPDVAVEADIFDQFPMALNVRNGTFNLESGDLHDHSKADYLTQIIDIDYDREAECPRWLQFLSEIFDGDSDLIEFIQRAVGYSLTGDVKEQKLFFLHGTGANGKSVFIEVVKALLGSYAKSLTPDAIMEKKYPGIPVDIANLRGVRFAPTVEVGQGRRMAEVLVKQLTGGDTISVRNLYENPFDFKPEAKIWLCANHKPVIRGTDRAIWRRINLIPFLIAFEGDRDDKDLLSKLLTELPGILNWACNGCLKWLKSGLNEPKSVLLATQTYKRDSDTLGNFIEECLDYPTADHLGFSMQGKEIAALYATWAEENKERKMTTRQINSELEGRGWEYGIGKGNKKIWLNASEHMPINP